MAKDAVDTIPVAVANQAVPEQEMMTIIVDPKATDGGIIINEKRYIGEMKVPVALGRQIMENMQTYAEAKNKMYDPSQKIRNKNGFEIEKAYLADPSEHSTNPRFNQEFGLLDPWQWQFVAEAEKDRLRQLKTSIYGYITTK